MKGLLYPKTLKRGDKDIQPAVGEVDLFDDLCHRPYFVQITDRRRFGLVLQHHETHQRIAGHRVIDNFDINGVSYHNGGKNPRKNRTAHQRHHRQPGGKNLVNRHYLV